MSGLLKLILKMEQIFKYIRKDSLDNARKVKKDKLSAVALLESYPDRYPLDKEKIDNDGSFRCLILHKYRVSIELPHQQLLSYAYGTPAWIP